MKNYTIAILAAALTLSGCSLDRLPLNGPSTGTFPQNESEAYSGTLAAYKGMSLMNAQNCYFPYAIEDCASDIFTYRPTGKNFYQQLDGTLTATHALVEKEYSYVYKVVGRVHQVLDKIDNLLETEGQDVVDRYKAELLCIRAHQYDQAMQFYGGIPFIDHCLTLEDNDYPRNTLKQCADSIIKVDLQDDVLDCLPVTWDATYGTTRIGRIAAYALKARIALNWGYVDVARLAAEKAIKLNNESGSYSLETKLDTRGYLTHDEGEIDNTALWGFEGQKSDEWLWAIQHSKLVGELQTDIYYTTSRCLAGCSWYGPNPSLIDTYQCLDGKSILESPLYDCKNPYLNRDPRMAMTAVLPGSRSMGYQYEMDYTVDQVKNYSTDAMVPNADSSPNVNKYQYGANGTLGPGGFYFRKHHDISYISAQKYSLSDTDDELNTGIIRWAEVLLIAAEANIEDPAGNLSKAKEYINEIRARVGMPDITVSSREDLRSALRYERKVELAGEGFRWFDLRRWSDDGLCYKNGEPIDGVEAIATTAVNGICYAPQYSSEKTGAKAYLWKAKPTIDRNWTVTYDGKSTFDGSKFDLRKFNEYKYEDYKDRRWPFPKTEIITSPTMSKDPEKYQNPGYVTGK